MKLRYVAGILGMGIVLVWMSTGRSSERAPFLCPPAQNVVRVETASHRLGLCEQGVVRETFSVRLGRNGTGKEAEGDRKTPLGTYALGGARSSSAYGTFIPIGYPTEAQRQRGYTGSAVGVHGPHRSMLWLGSKVNVVDSTDGCVGIASDEEMSRIQRWVSTAPASTIVLE